MAGSSAGITSRAPLAALRYRDFRLFASGQFAGASGFWIATLAQGWLVLQLTHSATWLGLISFLGSAPTLLLTPLGGVVADRVAQRRPLIAAAALLIALLLGLLATLTAFSVVAVEHVAAIVLLMGVVYAFDQPARMASVANLVPRQELLGALALYSAAYNATRFVGPAVAGFAAASLGLAATLGLAAMAYASMLAATLALRQPLPSGRVSTLGVMGTLEEGLRYVYHEPRLRVLVLLVATNNLLSQPLLMLMPLFADRVFAVGVAGLGQLLSAVGMGALGGAVTLILLGQTRRASPLVYGALFAMLGCLLLFATTPPFPVALALLFLSGWAGQIYSTSTNTLLQTIAPDQMRGRVASLFTITWGLGPIGALPMGALADLAGAPWAIAAGVSLNALVALAAWRLQPRLDP